MYQACLIKLPETQLDSTQQVQMINCIMSDAAPDSATTKVCIVFTNSLKVFRLYPKNLFRENESNFTFASA